MSSASTPDPNTNTDGSPTPESVDTHIFEDRYYSPECLEEPLRDLVSFPSDDILIETIPRFHRSPAEFSIPPPDTPQTLLPSVKECFNFFAQDWLTVRYQYSKFTRDDASPTVNSLTPLLYPDNASSTSQKSEPAPAPLNQSITDKSSTPDMAKVNVSSKTLPRNNIIAGKKERPNSSMAIKTEPNAVEPPAGSGVGTRPTFAGGLNRSNTVKENTLRSIAQSGGAGSDSVLRQLDSYQLGLMEKCTPETDRRNAEERAKDRISIFRYYEPDYDWDPGNATLLCFRSNKFSDPNAFLKYNYSPFQFVVNVKKLDLPPFEPFFSSLGLYDLATKRKISETYFFEDNDMHAQELIKDYREEGDPVTMSKSVLFTVQKPSDTIYLVFQMEKVLSGDLEAAAEYYAKSNTKKEFSDKMKLDARNYCQRLGAFRQPFAWAAVPVFEAGKFVLDRVDSFKNILLFGKEGVVDSILEYNKSKKGKILTGSLSMSAFEWNSSMEDNYRILDASWNILSHVDYASSQREKGSSETAAGPPTTVDQKPYLRELQEFPNTPYLHPFWSYVNNLYVYPASLNFAGHNRKFRNIVIKIRLKDTDDVESPGLPVIYGKWSQAKFKTEASTQVFYHNRTPSFQDEIKILLPTTLTPKHHLLFTFYHLVCDSKKKTKTSADEKEVYAGYAFLPLFVDGRLNTIPAHLPVNTNKMESGYTSGPQKPAYLESGKPVFQLNFQVISTVYPLDPNLCDIFRAYNSNDMKKPDFEKVKNISTTVAIQYFPILCNLLLKQIAMENARAGNSKGTHEMFLALLSLILKVKQTLIEPSQIHNPLLSFYVQYVFVGEGKGSDLYFLLLKDFFVYCSFARAEPTKVVTEEHEIYGISWFLFDMIIRSITLTLAKDNRVPDVNRKTRPEEEKLVTLYPVLDKMVLLLVSLIKERKNTINVFALNNSASLFVRDLFTIIHRGTAIQSVEKYSKNMTAPDAQGDLNIDTFKYSFLEIVTDYEHFVPINFPVAHSYTSDFHYSTFRNKHPLSTLVAEEVVNSLCTANKASRPIAINLLFYLLMKHDYDERYRDQERRARIAQTYFLLLHRLIEDHSRLANWREKSELHEKREFLIGVVWLFKNLDRLLLRSWWRSLGASNPRQVILLDLWGLIVNVFEYKADFKHQRRNRTTVTMAMSAYGAYQPKEKERPHETFLIHNGLLCYEVNVLILDLLEDFISDFRHELGSSESSEMMDKVFGLLLNMMKKNQSEKFLSHLYATLRSFASKFPSHLFQANNSYCGNLIAEILRHCNFTSDIVRTEASTFFYLLLKHNQRAIGNFGRMRIQSITALSKFKLMEDVYVKNSFARLAQYAFHDYGVFHTPDDPCDNKDSGSSYQRAKFARGVQDLSVTLSKILQDTIRINLIINESDYETVADLYYQIANGYSHTPDLRIEKLKELSHFHLKENNDAEAAFCFIHAAHLIADYLSTEKGIPIDTQLFKTVSPSSAEFADPDSEGTCQTSDFSQKGMKELLKKAINGLEQAEMFEYGAQLYKILTPLFEKDHNYRELSQAHLKLNVFWDKVLAGANQRLFATFFRVGFWGEPFEENDGKEYIYRMPKLYHLFELSQKLKDRYSKLFGEDMVVVIQDSHPVDRSKLEKGKAYLQITHLEPYFSPDDPKPRTTEFEKNVNLDQFTFMTPFTKTGKTHGSIAEQCKRKTICCIDIPFPYMITRLPVTRKYIVEISPIESSIETIEQRVETLMSEVQKKNLKTLQQVLQGSVRLQVNAGAMEICRIFLGEASNFPQDQVLKLCSALKGFLKACEQLLQLNKDLASFDDPAQESFHQEMTTGYNELVAEMSSFLKKAEPVSDDLTTSA